MKNTFGSSITVTLFGESHGEEIGVILDGFAPGIEIRKEEIEKCLDRRRPAGKLSTKRVEADRFRIVSGVFNGYTTGTPITILIPNENVRSKDYSKTRFLARPGHADYTAFCKYHGFEDYRGGGHFSGRLTAALTAAGAIGLCALSSKGILVGSHIARCAGITDQQFTDIPAQIRAMSGQAMPVLDEQAVGEMRKAMEAAAEEGDSVGGILETAIWGMPAGVGEPWFDSMESILSHALFSVPAVKGVEFGAGFSFADMRGSQANDSFVVSDGNIETRTNNNGGINGGISNGMPILFRCVIKPTPSIFKEQDTVDFLKGEEKKLQIQGRHDPAIISRAAVVVDSVTALALCDMLAMRFGTDYLGG